MSGSKNNYKTLIVMLALLLLIGLPAYLAASAESNVQNNIIYVNQSAAGSSDGSSWGNAFTDLQAALAAARAGDQIWVAVGAYYPAVYEAVYESVYAPEVDRSATFQLKSGVALYGGFAGGETSLEERDWETNVTVLSGDLDRNDTTNAAGVVSDPDDIVGDNAYHVVTASGTGAGTILDGFTITGGHADNIDSAQHGGGLHVSNSELVLSNITFSGNQVECETGSIHRARGGAMYSINSDVELRNVVFSNNRAIRGGGLYIASGQLIVSDNVFINNRAESGGGGLFNAGQLTINNTLFSDNFSDHSGGGLFNAAGQLTVSNVDFNNNAIDDGNGAGLSTGISQDVTLTEINFTGNKTALDYPLKKGGGLYIGSGSYHADKKFTLVNATFSNNEAGDGGGIYIAPGSNDKKVLSNVLVSGNKSLYGGGIHCNAGNLSLINVTLSGNWSNIYGGAIYNSGQTPTLTNCIIWGNDDSYSSPLYNAFSGNLEFRHSIIQGSGGSGEDWDEDLGIDGGDNLDADPLFVEPVAASSAPTSSGNYRIQAGSPAVDAGSNSPFEEGGDAFGVETDLDGNRRIIGGLVDIGAYELVYEEVDTGSLTVTIEPEGVRGLGARWTVDGGTNWHESGTELDLDPGDYLLSFKKIEGLSEPPDADISVNRGFSTTITGIYRPEVIRVKYNATGNGDGSSWEDAYTCLHQALADSREGMEIWAAAGVYTPPLPTEGDPRTATFQLTEGVAVYGGFSGTETSRAERNWENNITVLSGDLDGDDTTDAAGVVTDPADIAGDNAYTVVTAADVGEDTILDGFVITAGKSDGEQGDHLEQRFGGGMYIENGNPTFQNLVITGCYGGGTYNSESDPTLTDIIIKSNHGIGMRNDYSSPSLTRVLFESNTGDGFNNTFGGGMNNIYSDPILNQVDFINNGDWWAKSPGYGGGMVNSNSNPTLINVTFRGNYAYYEGGGMRNSSSSPTLINVLFSGNATAMRGGGMYNSGSTNQPTLVNVTFSSNYAGQYGGAMFNRSNASPTLINCIVWQNYAPVLSFTVETEIWNDGAVPTFSNSIVRSSGGSSNWNSYFGTDGGNNLDNDPLFIYRPMGFTNTGHTSGDFRLQEGSPAIDGGTNSPFEAGGDAYGVTTDLDGNPRIENGIVDMGSYEYQDTPESEAVVSTPAELAAALQNQDITTIRFSSDISADISAGRLVNLDFSNYALNGNVLFETSEAGDMAFTGSAEPAITGNLTVYAPNATVTNNVEVDGSVIISDVAGSTWVENAHGNDLVIDVQNGTTTVIINGNVNTLTVNGSGDGLDILINGSVQTAVFNAPASVEGAENIISAHIASEGVDLDESPQQYVYRLSLLVNPENSGTAAGEGLYAEGEIISVIAQAKSGYRFVNWTSPEGAFGDANAASTSFTMPSKDTAITANFEAVSPTSPTRTSSRRAAPAVTAEHTLSIGVEGKGTVSPETGEHTYDEGTVVELEAVPAEGWLFMEWAGPVEDTKSPTTTVTMDEDVQVTAFFGEQAVVEPEPPAVIAEDTVIVLVTGSKKALVNDVEHFMDVAPFINLEVKRTMIPARFISEYLGAEVHWLPDTRQVIMAHGDTEIILNIGSDTALVNGEEVPLDCPAKLLESRTFVPLRFVSEILGATVHWEGNTQTITITMTR